MKLARVSALVLGLAAGGPLFAASASREVLPFIQDDFPKALAQARAKNVPIFLEAWAPW